MTSNIVLALAKKDIEGFNPQTQRLEITGRYKDKGKKTIERLDMKIIKEATYM